MKGKYRIAKNTGKKIKVTLNLRGKKYEQRLNGKNFNTEKDKSNAQRIKIVEICWLLLKLILRQNRFLECN